MEERKEIIRSHVAKGVKVEFAARLANMSKSTYYYKSRGGKPGRKPSTHTINMRTNSMVPNEYVVQTIKEIIGQEFMENGYRKVTYELKDMGFYIGKTKTFRLMKAKGLMLPHKRKGSRVYVRFTQPLPLMPFQHMEMDIKFVYIRGDRKNALLITILDTFTRAALAWRLQYSIKHTSVADLFTSVIENWLLDFAPCFDNSISVTLRSDNDGRFNALALKEFLNKNFINHEFILPATPQQNAHIESFHSIVEQLVCKKYEFSSIAEARNTFERFYQTYNYRRTISSILYLPPMAFLNECFKNNIGVNMKKIKGKIIQKFFFRGQRLNWHSALPEEFFGVNKNNQYKAEITNFVKQTLIKS